MSETNNVYKDRIIDMFTEMKTYGELLMKKNEVRNQQIPELRKTFEKNKDAEEIKQFAFDGYFLAGYENLDLQIMQAKFVNSMEFYLIDGSQEDFSKEINDAFDYIKRTVPKRMFFVKDGELVEAVAGSVEAKKQQFVEKNLYERVENDVKALLDVGKDK